MNHKARLQDNMPVSNGESGAVLLLSVIVMAILLGFIAWSTLSTTKTALTSAYQMNNDNQARVAALVGVSALTQYANDIYQHHDDASNGSSTCSPGTGLLGGLLGGLCNLTTGVVSGLLGSAGTSTTIPNGGNGGVAVYMHTGTTAQATLGNTAPFLGATVSAYVFSNTFTPRDSLSNPPTASAPGLITIVSQGASGHARATAVAVLGVKTVNTTPPAIQNKITLSGNAILDGNQFGGASIGATSGSTINGTSISGAVGTAYSIRSLKNITVVASIPAVYPDGFKSYASIQLLYNNGNPEMVIPQTASYIDSMYGGVAPGTYSYCTNIFGCYGSAANTAQSAFSTLGISYTSGGSINKGVWTLSSPLTAFIYSDGDVSLNFTGTAYISVAADGVVSTGATNGNGSSANDLYPFAQYPGVCSLFGNVCQQGQPIPDLEGFSISSNNGINLIHGTTIEGSIGSNGTIAYNGGGSITINGAIVASGLKVGDGSSLNVQGATKGSGLSSPNNISTFSGGQQIISLQSLYWK